MPVTVKIKTILNNMLQIIVVKVCMKEKSISIVEVVINLAAQKPSVMCILTARSVLLILEQSQHTFEDATGPLV